MSISSASSSGDGSSSSQDLSLSQEEVIMEDIRSEATGTAVASSSSPVPTSVASLRINEWFKQNMGGEMTPMRRRACIKELIAMRADLAYCHATDLSRSLGLVGMARGIALGKPGTSRRMDVWDALIHEQALLMRNGILVFRQVLPLLGQLLLT